MAQYHRKPQGPVEGFKWEGEEESLPAWAKEERIELRGNRLIVPTKAGPAVAHIGDHVLWRKPGDCYVVEAEDAPELFDIKEN